MLTLQDILVYDPKVEFYNALMTAFGSSDKVINT
ncbi:hypothetical protein RHCRD62_10747 [Rhodococcus sp. RD6.2]|jgi:hypothetical protein|nr:hypothetical protein RHCRD62_10747 [Rhodococcus sp. RD6.2]